MEITKKEKRLVVRLTDKNFKKLVAKAIDESQKRQKITSMTDIVTEYLETL